MLVCLAAAKSLDAPLHNNVLKVVPFLETSYFQQIRSRDIK